VPPLALAAKPQEAVKLPSVGRSGQGGGAFATAGGGGQPGGCGAVFWSFAGVAKSLRRGFKSMTPVPPLAVAMIHRPTVLQMSVGGVAKSVGRGENWVAPVSWLSAELQPLAAVPTLYVPVARKSVAMEPPLAAAEGRRAAVLLLSVGGRGMTAAPVALLPAASKPQQTVLSLPVGGGGTSVAPVPPLSAEMQPRPTVRSLSLRGGNTSVVQERTSAAAVLPPAAVIRPRPAALLPRIGGTAHSVECVPPLVAVTRA